MKARLVPTPVLAGSGSEGSRVDLRPARYCGTATPKTGSENSTGESGRRSGFSRDPHLRRSGFSRDPQKPATTIAPEGAPTARHPIPLLAIPCFSRDPHLRRSGFSRDPFSCMKLNRP